MAKLTLTDLSAGYQSAAGFNANFALIEAAFENTLSRDGTSPNTMNAALDMNSNNVNNVNTLNAGAITTTTLSLNGEAITTSSTLTGGLAASEVTYDSGTLQDKLDDEFPTNTDAETIAGAWTFNSTINVSGLASFDDVTVTGRLNMGSAGDADEYMGFGNRTGNDGTLNKKIAWEDTANWGGYDLLMQAGLQHGWQHARSGDGHCGIGMITDTLDGRMDIFATSDGLYSAGGSVTSHGLELSLVTSDIGGVGNGNAFYFKVNNANKLIIDDDWSTFNDYREGTFSPTLTPDSGSVTLSSTYDALSYTKVGRKVTVTGELRVASVSTPTGQVVLSDLPFSLASLGDAAHSFKSPIVVANLNTVADGFGLYIGEGTATLSAFDIKTVSGGAAATELVAGAELTFQFTYFTDD